VEGDLAAGVGGSLQATIDPYLYTITATIQPDGDYQRTLSALDDELKRLQDGLVPEEEIRRAAKQAKALFAYGTESITNQAFWLGYASMFADYVWFSTYVQQIESVTPDEVLDASRRLLNPHRRVVGVYQPTSARQGA
jgi:zinc protease